MSFFLLLLSLLTAPAAHATEQEDFEAYVNAYDYCDAEVLAAFWNVEVYAAKVRIGNHVRTGLQPVVDQALDAAATTPNGRAALWCYYSMSDFGYDDAELFASVWGTEVYDAKLKIGDALRKDAGDALREQRAALYAERGTLPGAGQIDLFWKLGFTYCDAGVLGALWGTDTFETKSRVSAKIFAGNTQTVNDELAAARPGFMGRAAELCPPENDGFYEGDIDAIATLWQQSYDDVRAQVIDKLYWGNISAAWSWRDEAYMAQEGADYGWYGGSEDLTFLEENGFPPCDAEMVGLLWGQDRFSAAYLLAEKVRTGDMALAQATVNEARAAAKAESRASCWYLDAGYGYEDVDALALLWRVDQTEAKWRAGELIFKRKDKKLAKKIAKAKARYPSLGN